MFLSAGCEARALFEFLTSSQCFGEQFSRPTHARARVKLTYSRDLNRRPAKLISGEINIEDLISHS
jgi:hypothetical protein